MLGTSTSPPLIYAQELEPEGFCCGSKRKRRQPVDMEDETESIAKFGECCGFRRRLICGGFYFPPRRSHTSHQSYAHVLTPVCIILDVVCALMIYFMFGSHELMHDSQKLLIITVVGSGVLLSTTAILHGLCVMSWWKSTFCCHYDFMGDFDEAEQNYYTGFGAAEQIGNGTSTLAFFSFVSPFSDTEGYADHPFGESDLEAHDALHIDSPNQVRDDKPSLREPTGLDLRATSNYLQHQRQIFYAKQDKLDKTKSAFMNANTAPCLICCGIPPSEYEYQ